MVRCCGTLIPTFQRSNVPMFNVLRDDFAFALRPLADHVLQDSPRDAFTDTLGRHLFTYYLWDLYPLKGPGSLIEQFYQQTGVETGSWGNLFDNMSRAAMDFEAEPLPVLSLYPMPESKALEDWSLPITEINGKISAATWEYLEKLPKVQEPTPLVCQIFNWSETPVVTGVRLPLLFESLGVDMAGARFFSFYSADGTYFETLPKSLARDPRVLLVSESV